MRSVTTPSLSSVCDFEQNLCGWLPDPRSGVTWSLRTASGAHGHGGHGNVEAELDSLQYPPCDFTCDITGASD
ncbi:unnamed protein product [Arctogadus glacialis]